MRTLFIITRADDIGGAQVYVANLAARMQADGHTVLVVTGRQGVYGEILAGYDIPTSTCPSLRHPPRPIQDLRATREILRIMSQFRPDLVSLHSSKAGILGRVASQMVGIPCVFTAHGWAFTDGVPQPQKALYRQIETWAAPWADQIICVSDYDRRLAISAGIPSQKLVTIHNGIPDTASRSIHRCKSRSVCITMVGRMADPKDPGILLHAVKAIPGVTVNFVGDGPKLGAYVDMSKQLGLSDRVQFLGHRSDVSPILRESDVFVLSSRYEGFPLSTLEAMREGLPTVVSDVGGAGEAVIDGVTGYLVPRGNVGAFRNRLEELVANPDVRLAMGRAARLFYEQEFTFSMMFERTIAVYQRIVERRTAFTLGYERPCEI